MIVFLPNCDHKIILIKDFLVKIYLKTYQKQRFYMFKYLLKEHAAVVIERAVVSQKRRLREKYAQFFLF